MTYPGTVPEYINQGNGHVLIVEKDTLQGHLLKVYLQEAGWVVRLATGPTEALAFCTYDLFDLAILNFTYLEDVDGFVLANLLYEQYQLPSLMITAARYIELSRCPAFSSDQDVLFKPYQLSECHRRLKRLLAGTPLLREHQLCVAAGMP